MAKPVGAAEVFRKLGLTKVARSIQRRQQQRVQRAVSRAAARGVRGTVYVSKITGQQVFRPYTTTEQKAIDSGKVSEFIKGKSEAELKGYAERGGTPFTSVAKERIAEIERHKQAEVLRQEGIATKKLAREQKKAKVLEETKKRRKVITKELQLPPPTLTASPKDTGLRFWTPLYAIQKTHPQTGKPLPQFETIIRHKTTGEISSIKTGKAPPFENVTIIRDITTLPRAEPEGLMGKTLLAGIPQVEEAAIFGFGGAIEGISTPITLPEDVLRLGREVAAGGVGVLGFRAKEFIGGTFRFAQERPIGFVAGLLGSAAGFKAIGKGVKTARVKPIKLYKGTQLTTARQIEGIGKAVGTTKTIIKSELIGATKGIGKKIKKMSGTTVKTISEGLFETRKVSKTVALTREVGAGISIIERKALLGAKKVKTIRHGFEAPSITKMVLESKEPFGVGSVFKTVAVPETFKVSKSLKIRLRLGLGITRAEKILVIGKEGRVSIFGTETVGFGERLVSGIKGRTTLISEPKPFQPLTFKRMTSGISPFVETARKQAAALDITLKKQLRIAPPTTQILKAHQKVLQTQLKTARRRLPIALPKTARKVKVGQIPTTKRRIKQLQTTRQNIASSLSSAQKQILKVSSGLKSSLQSSIKLAQATSTGLATAQAVATTEMTKINKALTTTFGEFGRAVEIPRVKEKPKFLFAIPPEMEEEYFPEVKRKKRRRGRQQELGFAPSLIGLELAIPQIEIPEIFTGLEIRGIRTKRTKKIKKTNKRGV